MLLLFRQAGSLSASKQEFKLLQSEVIAHYMLLLSISCLETLDYLVGLGMIETKSD